MATKKSIWLLIGILVMSAWVLGSFIRAEAETLRVKVTSYSTQVEVIQVGDTEGHILMPHTRRGLAFFENGDVATYTFWGTADLIKGKGTADGYTMFTFEDGSAIVYKVKAAWEPGSRGLAVGKGTGEFIKGTGRYEGIKGGLTWSGRGYTDSSKEKGTFGDFVLDVIATYTLLQK